MARSAVEIANREGYFWGDASAYFDEAERNIDDQWSTIVAPNIGNLAYETVLDLASGHGRNACRLAEKARMVTCVDVNPENIAFLKRRFAGDTRFAAVRNTGADLAFVPDDTIDLFYCFDAMVHFDLEIVQSYIKEAFRVTRDGGHAFVHVSNYTAAPGGDFRGNPHWRNFMSFELCTHLAIQAGFRVARADKLDWGGIPELDCTFLLGKGGRDTSTLATGHGGSR